MSECAAVTSRAITRERIAELAATAARCTWSDLFSTDDPPPPGWRETIDEYLKSFVAWQPKSPCVNCDTKQEDGIMSAIHGGFTWGIAHGEGFCEVCKWPARAYHVINDGNGALLCKFQRVLQYHPEQVKLESNG